MNVSFPPVNQFVNHVAHSASESIGTLGSRFVSLFQNRWVSATTLVAANVAFTIIGIFIATVTMNLFKKHCRGFFVNEQGQIPQDSNFLRVRTFVGVTSMVITMTVLNSAITRLLQMPLSRISTIAIATITGVATFAAIVAVSE